MSVVGNSRIEDQWAAEQTYPLWEELPTDITCNQVLTRLDPLGLNGCSAVCQQWNRFITSSFVRESLSRYHFPSIPPGFFKSFQAYQCFYFNFSKGICSIKPLQGHAHAINRFVLKDKMLFSASSDKTIKIWDLETNKCIETLEGHTKIVYCLALRGVTLISGSYDKTIKIWDLETKVCIKTFQGCSDGVSSFALRDAMLFSGYANGEIEIWDLESPTNTPIAILKGHTNTVASLIFRRETLISGSLDNTIKIWDLGTKTCTATLQVGKWVMSLFLRDAMLFSSNVEKEIEIWDLESPTNAMAATLLIKEEEKNSIFSIAPIGKTLFLGVYDGQIRIWDLETKICRATLKEGSKNSVQALALGEGTLFSGSSNGTIKIWDFTASHAQIFMEIADGLESEDEGEGKFALERYSKMPKAVKNKIERELYEVVKSQLKRDDQEYAKDALYGENLQSITNAQRAQAIKNYLKTLS